VRPAARGRALQHAKVHVRLEDFVAHLAKHPPSNTGGHTHSSCRPGELAKAVNIYRAFISAAEAAGSKPICQLAGEWSGP